MSTRADAREPDPVDRYVGRRLHRRRTEMGLSPGHLGHAIDKSAATIAAYEAGTRSVGASQLFLLCQALDVPVSYFYAGLPADSGRANIPGPGSVAPDEAVRFVRTFYSIGDPGLRRELFEMVKSVARNKKDPSL